MRRIASPLAAALAYLSEFFEQAKRSGAVQRAIDGSKLRGVTVAPDATKENITPGGGY